MAHDHRLGGQSVLAFHVLHHCGVPTADGCPRKGTSLQASGKKGSVVELVEPLGAPAKDIYSTKRRSITSSGTKCAAVEVGTYRGRVSPKGAGSRATCKKCSGRILWCALGDGCTQKGV